jgi:hypothetical protein
MFSNMGVGVGRACVIVGRIFLGLGFKSPSSPFFVGRCINMLREKHHMLEVEIASNHVYFATR